ncbi:GNAT family N-acetyltransferase [Microbacterium sp. ISL-103]|uniref:GNAT family N-acetyltransferase n=1 Tax=Microbacterium sp. ISL-103 TaxID=2819156 RepID=UPI002035FE98|nr:GNAT family N-acetyltransferase [Microbacterium sp. ISL-103]
MDADPTPEQIVADRATLVTRRNVGVFEQEAPEGTLPVATVNSWVTPLTIPGGEVDMWAISAVTVSGTHRRRGIARNLLEGELRAAADAGIPLAGLTVSEATIYERYGFASAIPAAKVSIDAPRAGWNGPATDGRIEYIERESLQSDLSALHEEARTQRAGQIAGWDARWERIAGLSVGHTAPRAVRGVRYVDADGAVRGAMAYSLKEVSGSFRADMEIHHLASTTTDALAALWRFALQHDLVSKVVVDLRPVDDPITWLVTDQRGVELTPHDHGWLRILDVPAVLTARSYRAPLDLVLRVDDALGFAEGLWRLTTDADGAAAVVRLDGDVEADVELAVGALSAIYAGGVSAVRLRAAGRLRASAETAAALDDAFRTSDAPLLGIWY